MNQRAVATELAAWLRPDAAGEVRDAGADPTVGWVPLLDCAAAHQLLPALWSSMVRAGVRPLPAALRDRVGSSPFVVLEDAYAANAARVEDLAAQGRDVLAVLQDAGIPALPIKGLHGLLAGWWADPAARVMVDIDVLVAEAHVVDAAAAVRTLGYRDLGTLDPEGIAAHQRPALGRPGHEGSLELHTTPLVVRHAVMLPTAELFAGADTLDVDGRTVPVPNPTHAMVLTLAHAVLQDDDARLLRLPLRALADVAALVGRGLTDAIDWHDVRARFARRHATPPLAGFAVALDELFGCALPVSTKGGRAWLSATWWAADHPGAAQRYREAVSVPRSLSAARMERLYDAHTVTDRTVARARHVAAGVRRRVGRPSSPRPLAIGAYMTTTASRAEVLAETLANLAATDWGAAPVLILDQGLDPDAVQRITLTGRAVLEAGASGPGELFLCLEDDLEFNGSLRHNLERWPPVVAHTPGAHFFGSLYDPDIVPLDAPERATATFIAVPPDHVYGSQAWLLSRATARHVLEHWDELSEPFDIRVSRLAGRVTPLWYHMPSLVQHRPVASVWGGRAHRALDYDGGWRASDQPS